MRFPRVTASLLLAMLGGGMRAQGFHERHAIAYSRTEAANAATELNRRLLQGELELPVDGKSGRLRSLLHALLVPESSQMLVFSKTSLQRHRVSAQNPRALFFGPDAYVGWVPGGAALEVAVGDEKLGLVFYTLTQDAAVKSPQLVRDDSCLSCHASAHTDDEPGLLLRSVFVDADSDPITAAGETEVTLRTPLRERWGGWLLTGQFTGAHRGNGFAQKDAHDHYVVQGRVAADLTAFAADFEVDAYPARSSDVAALLAFEQQATVHNLLIRSSFQMRCLLENDREINHMLGESGLREQSVRVADRLATSIAATLLFGDEASLAGRRAAPAAAFAGDFAAQWPVDADGGRLGEFDLRQRLFVLPLSPMVHGAAFTALPGVLRDRVLARLRLALRDGQMPEGCFLTAAQCAAVDRHLRATLAGY